jgi:chromosome segregation ATPase
LEIKASQLEGELLKLRNLFQQETRDKEQLGQSKKDLETQLAALVQTKSQILEELKHKDKEFADASNEKAQILAENKDLRDQLDDLRMLFEQATKAKSDTDKTVKQVRGETAPIVT